MNKTLLISLLFLGCNLTTQTAYSQVTTIQYPAEHSLTYNTAFGLLSDQINLTVLRESIDNLNLEDAINVEELTIFAPTDEAFESLDQSIKDRLLSDEEYLLAVVKNHIVQTKIGSQDFTNQVLSTAHGDEISMVVASTFTVGGGDIITTDLTSKNAKVHTINKVLLPQE